MACPRFRAQYSDLGMTFPEILGIIFRPGYGMPRIQGILFRPRNGFPQIQGGLCFNISKNDYMLDCARMRTPFYFVSITLHENV